MEKSRPSRYTDGQNPIIAHCGGKHSFPSWATADRAMKRKQRVQKLRGRDVPPLVVYACHTCGGFYIGGHRVWT